MNKKIAYGLAALALVAHTMNPCWMVRDDKKLLAGMVYFESRGCVDSEKLQIASGPVNRARDNDPSNGTDLRSALTSGAYHGLDGFLKGVKILNLSSNHDPTYKKCFKIGEEAIRHPVPGRYFHLKGPKRSWTKNLIPIPSPSEYKHQHYL